MNNNDLDKLLFCTGVGRCGTRFVHELLKRAKGVCSFHELNPIQDSFHKYCKWNNLPIDSGGFLKGKENEIKSVIKNDNIFFEASPFLILSIKDLFEKFENRFLLLYRNPEKSVRSFYSKGFYQEDIDYNDLNLTSGLQSNLPVHRSFTRIYPKGKKFLKWKNLTRVGKISWYWSVLNKMMLEQIKEIPKEKYRIFNIEEFNYDVYHDIIEWIGLPLKISNWRYNRIRNKSHSYTGKKNYHVEWSKIEIEEFESQTTKVWQSLINFKNN